jgi:hypothetical protein
MEKPSSGNLKVLSYKSSTQWIPIIFKDRDELGININDRI